MKYVFYCLTYLLFGLGSIQAKPIGPSNIYQLTIDDSQSINTIDKRYLSFTIDTSTLIHHQSLPKTKRLYNYIHQLLPAFLRVGGTSQDNVCYKQTCVKHHQFGQEHLLSRAKIQDLFRFANDASLKLIFGLNGYWPRDTKTGLWQTNHAQTFFKTILSKDFKHASVLYGVELGNEPNSWVNFGHKITARELFLNHQRLRKLVDNSYQDSQWVKPRIIGPNMSNHYYGVWNDENMVETFMANFSSDKSPIDIFSWHYYPLNTKSNRHWDLATIEKLTNPIVLNQDRLRAKSILRAVHQKKPLMPVWIGETASVSGGGEKRLSNTFANGFWYLDELAMYATEGGKVLIRQDLIGGGGYSLLSLTKDGVYAPSPDYWTALLWKRLIGTDVLSVTQHALSPSNLLHSQGDLRTYAFCDKEKQAVNLVYLNMRYSPIEINSIKLQGREVLMTGGKRKEYQLSNANILAQSIRLNNKLVETRNAKQIPALTPKQVDNKKPVILQANSYGFIQFPVIDKAHSICRGKSSSLTV